ncbi:hypothetical protein NITHO_1560007 [Nitrolancea hollandica Lb]|uniref:Uncharacterized protein n=1 Tax=Nitrolancea hollandica Lb TaxID=1129897 RepID=I4EDL7_9BACT|nr:hypothetical protein NITHO_1560007 [Nitrolancea hollandica Lb]
MPVAGIFQKWQSWRRDRQRERDLVRIRTQLAQRGVPVSHLSDDALEALIADGRRVLDSAGIHGGDTTGAFVVVVRDRENI